MLRQRNRYKIFMAGVAAAAILLSVFRIVVMINHIQINTVGIDFYLDRVPAVTAFDISAAAICIAAAVFSFFLGKTASRKLEYDTAAVIFTSALSGFMMLSSGLYLLYRFLRRGSCFTHMISFPSSLRCWPLPPFSCTPRKKFPHFRR